MTNKNAKLIIFTGPSGVGKGTILKTFFERVDCNIVYSISCTTRQPRNGEIDGVHYFFKSKSEFENLIKEDAFLEYANYNGNYYGTSKKFVNEKIKEGKSVLLEIELQGAIQVMDKYPENVSIFIKPPSFEELKKRLIGRNSEDIQTIENRLNSAKRELENINKFKYVIENNVVEDAVCELIKIYSKEVQ